MPGTERWRAFKQWKRNMDWFTKAMQVIVVIEEAIGREMDKERTLAEDEAFALRRVLF